ncbi:hypothetical protein CAPTEDRAFT_219553 [Capitella teleta]|uniref:SUEL-type lectin domain-containing protein n=1 Tax=Capitella teleta TaxID=283909 RepID=R7VFD5_CAPTE|nr:hypothetical protein CAPTEDRAFT_219553 [Capitella teleta]|eukprot:ELU17324.1 hypothetical protein CAPTEDRAFT_219553 [Capitella teleta]
MAHLSESFSGRFMVSNIDSRCLFFTLESNTENKNKRRRFTMKMKVPSLRDKAQVKEYCNSETFKANCQEGQVIMMNTALYGRMRIGQCSKTDFGYIGCSSDVLHLMDRRCSGRRTCSVRVADSMFDEISVCNAEFKSYLEASFSCVTVVSPKATNCRTPGAVIVTKPEGALSNMVTEETGCGGESTPWRIQGSPGQQVNLTLLDFFWTKKGAANREQTCLRYAVVRERGTGHRINVCGGGMAGRTSHVHTSSSGALDVVIFAPTQRRTEAYFMFQFNVYGCADPYLASDQWLRREGDRATIGCQTVDESESSWRLECLEGQWVGPMPGNCSYDWFPIPRVFQWFEHLVPPIRYVYLWYSTIHQIELNTSADLAVVIIVGVAITCAIFIFLIGILMLRWRRRHGPPRGRPRCELIMEPHTQTLPSQRQHLQMEPSKADKDIMYHGSVDALTPSNENDYAYVWDYSGQDSEPTRPIPHNATLPAGFREFSPPKQTVPQWDQTLVCNTRKPPFSTYPLGSLHQSTPKESPARVTCVGGVMYIVNWTIPTADH